MAKKLQNQWLIQNNTVVQALKRQLLEYGFKGGIEINAKRLQEVLESSIIEIFRLQRELDEVTANHKMLLSSHENLKKVLESTGKVEIPKKDGE